MSCFYCTNCVYLEQCSSLSTLDSKLVLVRKTTAELDLQVDVAQKNHAEIEENYPSGRHSMLTLATQIQSMAQ